MKKLILLFFIALFFFSFVIAQPPQTFVGDVGLQIESPLREAISFNQTHSFHFHVFNLSTGLIMTDDDVSCIFHMYNDTGTEQIKLIPTFEAPVDFEVKVLAPNFTRLGMYNYIFQCNNSDMGGFSEVEFKVTPSGEVITDAQSIAGIGLIFSIILLAGLFTFFGFKFFESDTTFPMGIFFIVMAMILGVYTLHIGYIVSRDVLFPMSMEGSQFKMYMGVTWGLLAMAFFAMLGLIMRAVKEIKIRKSYNQIDDGWQEKAYKPGINAN